MKKILALVLALCMVLALCACGAKGVTGLTAEDMAPSEPAASAAEPAAEPAQAASWTSAIWFVPLQTESAA